jgi:hypothetical protein
VIRKWVSETCLEAWQYWKTKNLASGAIEVFKLRKDKEQEVTGGAHAQRRHGSTDIIIPITSVNGDHAVRGSLTLQRMILSITKTAPS